MGVKLDNVMDILAERAEDYAAEWAQGDNFVSKDDEAAEVYSWQEGWRPKVVGELSAELRKNKGKGSWVGKNQLAEFTTARFADVIEAENQASGPGKGLLSEAEVKRIVVAHPGLGLLVQDAWISALATQRRERETLSRNREEATFLATPINSLDAWAKAPRAQRELAVEIIYPDNVHPSLEGHFRQSLESIPQGPRRVFAEKMLRFMEENASLELDNNIHATVGQPEIDVEMLTLADGTPVGGTIRIFQNGAMHPEDESGRHFDTESDAIAAGFDVGADVSWSASAAFDFDLKPFRYDDYLGWSGH